MNSTVQIHISASNGISRLASAFFNSPFKIANITEDKHDPTIRLMLMCSSPGILDGDEQTLNITLDADSRLQLFTQSYQRLFTMKTGASQSMDVNIGAGAHFTWLPHPVVPHNGSIFKCRNRIVLGEKARLVWGEVLTCGRKLTGEVFTLSVYHSRTEIFIKNRLALLDNQYLNPAALPVNALGQLENYTHQASFITTETANRADIASCLAAQPDFLAGITTGPAGLLVVRLLGQSAEPMYTVLKTLADICNHQTVEKTRSHDH